MVEKKSNSIEISPQPGPQEKFLSTTADIAIYGGAAGGGKSFALLLDPLRHFNNEKFNGVIFRRTTPQITNPGGLWDEAAYLYMPLAANPNQQDLTFQFKSGMTMKFAHLEHDKNIYDWQGAQIPYIGFDELTHFSEKQFFYMLSRNRSTSGVPGYVRATTNPDSESWVRKFLDWWIGDDGYPIAERDGIIRWFVRRNNEIIWSDTKEDENAKSVTFISALLSDNKIFVEKDPSYKANLESLPYVERMRLLKGNWNVRPSAGNFFKSRYFEIVDALPQCVQTVRYWDRAASEEKTADYTVGVKMHRTSDNQFYISDVIRFQGSPLKVRTAIKNAASQDGRQTVVGIEQDPGQAGLVEAQDYVRLLAGYVVKLNKVSSDKQVRASPLSAQAEAGNVKLVKGPWNDAFISELESFPDVKFDDQVDSASGAFHILTEHNVGEFRKEHSTKTGSKFVRNEDYD